MAGYATVGAGVAPRELQRIIAVAKAYATCVGAGPFVGELEGEQAGYLRRLGNETGSTTGRVRRVAWLDLLALSWGVKLQGAGEVALTMLDVLSGLQRVPVCVAYECAGRLLDEFPLTPYLDECRPRYVELPGWQEDLSECRRWEDLPQAARNYVAFVERKVGVPITLVGVGPRREQVVHRGSDRQFANSRLAET